MPRKSATVKTPRAKKPAKVAAEKPAEKPAAKVKKGRAKREKTSVFDRADFILSKKTGEGWRSQRKAIEKSNGFDDAEAWIAVHCAEVLWARSVLAADPILYPFVDTETTGTGVDASITDIAIALHNGLVLIDSLVKPASAITMKASAITGIYNAELADAPTFAELAEKIDAAFRPATAMIAYNGDFDRRLIEQSAYYADSVISLPPVLAPDVMIRFAVWVGDWDPRHLHYKWHKLESGHRALGDTQAMIRMVRAMAASTAPEER
jgi:hypothetical protein